MNMFIVFIFALAGFIASALFTGIEIPMLKKQDGVVYLNPGSVSFPKNGFPPSYAVFEEREIQVLPLDGGEPIYVLSLA